MTDQTRPADLAEAYALQAAVWRRSSGATLSWGTKVTPLVIIGEGGSSGYLFQYAADTFVREHGGERYTVHDGDEFVAAMQDFASKHGPIRSFIYMGHGNEVGLYVNQAPGVNGALYANDPALNELYRAASIYDLSPRLFASGALATFYGCNVAKERLGFDSFAEHFADHFRVDVIASEGPTEFSFDADGKEFVKGPVASINRPVYMIPTAQDKGFVDIKPSLRGIAGYDDVTAGMEAADAIAFLDMRGLRLVEAHLFRPYQSITGKDARAFCKVVNPSAACVPEGGGDADLIRNTAFLKMLLDAQGIQLKKTADPYQAQISFAAANGLLTPDFTRRRWFSRAEAAMLTANIVRFRDRAETGSSAILQP